MRASRWAWGLGSDGSKAERPFSIHSRHTVFRPVPRVERGPLPQGAADLPRADAPLRGAMGGCPASRRWGTTPSSLQNGSSSNNLEIPSAQLSSDLKNSAHIEIRRWDCATPRPRDPRAREVARTRACMNFAIEMDLSNAGWLARPLMKECKDTVLSSP